MIPTDPDVWMWAAVIGAGLAPQLVRLGYRHAAVVLG